MQGEPGSPGKDGENGIRGSKVGWWCIIRLLCKIFGNKMFQIVLMFIFLLNSQGSNRRYWFSWNEGPIRIEGIV